MQTTITHPEGPEHQVVSEQNRGRWRCRDLVDVGASMDNKSVQLPATRVDDGSQSPPPASDVPFGQGSGVDHPGGQPDETENRNTDDNTQDSQDYDETPSTSKQHACLPELSPVLDSNFNASPRRLRCRTTKTGHTPETARDTEPGAEWSRMRRSSDVGVMVLLMAVAASVMSPYLFSYWSLSFFWHWLFSIGCWVSTVSVLLVLLQKLLMQAVTVLLSTAVVLLAVQAHFPNDRLRQWIAGVFQLEMKEAQSNPRTKISTGDDSPPSQALTTTGDGDKELISNLDSTNCQHEDGVVQKQSENFPACVAEKQTNPRGCINKAQTELTNQRSGDIEGLDHVTQRGWKPGQGKCARNAMKNMYRKFLLIRRKYRTEMWGLRQTDKAASRVLSRVQLTLPVLEREKQALLAELEAIHKQHEEEKRRNHDLLVRLHRLNQQFVRIGTPQASVGAPRMQSQEHPSFSSGSLTPQQPHQYLHHHHPYHQQQQQQQQCSRLSSATTHNVNEEMRVERAHTIHPSLRPVSLPH